MKTKTVFKTDEIAHLWANSHLGKYKYGRTQTGHFSFNAETLKSYGTDIARRVTIKGKTAYLLNDRHYSNTTNGHQSDARRAIPDGARVFTFCMGTWQHSLGRGWSFPYLRDVGIFVYESLRKESLDWIDKAKNARSTKAWKLEKAMTCAKEANAVREFFCIKGKCKEIPLDAMAMQENEAKRKRQEDKAYQIRAEKRRIEEAKERVENQRLGTLAAIAWRKSEETFVDAGVSTCSVKQALHMATLDPTADGFEQNAILRLSTDKTRVETSMGAQVLVRSVQFLYKLCLEIKGHGNAQSWSNEPMGGGITLDNYRLNAIDTMGNVTAGCHRIAFAEIEGIAKQLGLV